MLHFFRACISPKPQQKANWRSQLHAQGPKIHSNPLKPSEKIAFVKKDKECAICAILTEKNHFGAYTEAKNVLHVVRCAKHAPQKPKNNANPSGVSEKMFIV